MQTIDPPPVVAAHTLFRGLDSPVSLQWYCSLVLEPGRTPLLDISSLRVQDLRIMKSNKGLLHEYVVATVVADRPSESTDCVYLAFERYSTYRRGSKQATDASDTGEPWESHTLENSQSPTATLDSAPVIDGGHSSNSSLDSSSFISKLIHKLRSFCTLPLHGYFTASAGSLDSSSKLVHPFQAGDYVCMLEKPSKCGGDTQVGLLKFNDPDSPLCFYELAFLALAVGEKQPNYSSKFHCYWFAGMIAFALEKLKDLRLPKSSKRGKTPFMNWEAMPKPKDTVIIQQVLRDYGKHVSAFVTEAQQLDAPRSPSQFCTCH